MCSSRVSLWLRIIYFCPILGSYSACQWQPINSTLTLDGFFHIDDLLCTLQWTQTLVKGERKKNLPPIKISTAKEGQSDCFKSGWNAITVADLDVKCHFGAAPLCLQPWVSLPLWRLQLPPTDERPSSGSVSQQPFTVTWPLDCRNAFDTVPCQFGICLSLYHDVSFPVGKSGLNECQNVKCLLSCLLLLLCSTVFFC